SSSCLLSGRSPSRVGFAHSTGHATDTATLVLQDKSIPQRGNSLPPSGVSRREQDKSWRGGSADTSAHVLLRQANPSKTAKPPLRDALSSCSLLDVGSGAGFPGIPIKLLYPELQVSLLDSAKKRCDYLRSLLEHIKLPCEVLQGRSEELSILPQYREQYDFVTARAVANLSALCEYCLPFAKVGGRFFAMKGSNAHEELAVAENAITLLGGSVSDVYDYELPDGAKRVLVIIDKIKPTPKEYPRQRVNISKKPVR
ncbi:MAG: 16S rRNA (guanine(527)-N(7))-methyltransferase RsmG, partial [Oscillospiraceae bacterium]|nr:16S rRNA (guanine(527)-N(7))-methyltransferase RsmG [Oscillospiraceae bacterium]